MLVLRFLRKFDVGLITKRAFFLFLVSIALGLHGEVSPEGAANLIAGAKGEGSVAVYSTMTLDESQRIVNQFEKKYPFLKVSIYRTGGAALLNRILSEDRGGKHDFDLVMARGDMVLPMRLRGLLAPYASPEQRFYEDDLKDSQGY